MKYKFRQVGTTRHPEIYNDDQSDMLQPVVTNVDKELTMWKAAEKIVEIFNEEEYTPEQAWFIWHYVNALMGMSETEELRMMEFIRFRLYMARIVELLDNKELKKRNFG